MGDGLFATTGAGTRPLLKLCSNDARQSVCNTVCSHTTPLAVGCLQHSVLFISQAMSIDILIHDGSLPGFVHLIAEDLTSKLFRLWNSAI